MNAVFGTQAQNAWRIWDPPIFPCPPANSTSHVVLPLKVFICSQIFVGTLENNALLVDKIDNSIYQNILTTINSHLRKPLLIYLIAKCLLTFISFLAAVSLILAVIFLDFYWVGGSGVCLLAAFFFIRFSGNRYYLAMYRLRPVLAEVAKGLQAQFLGEHHVSIVCGECCAWIDFCVEGEEEVKEPVTKIFHVFTPGMVTSKGMISLPLL